MILMYYPLRDEIKLFSGSPPTYSAKPSERGVIKVINQICSLVGTFTSIADDAFFFYKFYKYTLHKLT